MSEPLDLPVATETLQNAPFGILILDNDRQIVWINKAFGKLLNIDTDNLIGKAADEIPFPGFKSVLDLNDDIVTTKSAQHGNRWLKCWHQAMEINNAIVGNAYFLIDVSDHYKLLEEFERIQKELEAKSTRDPLTGLLNRRGLMQVLDAQASRSRRYNNPLSLIHMQINDYTYSNGKTPNKDKIFVAIGHLFNDQLRWADVSGRLDNEDFLLILPETETDAATKLVDKIKAGLEELTVGKDEQKVSLKVCFGVTSWAKGDDQGKLLARAKEAMTAAKNYKEPVPAG